MHYLEKCDWSVSVMVLGQHYLCSRMKVNTVISDHVCRYDDDEDVFLIPNKPDHNNEICFSYVDQLVL